MDPHFSPLQKPCRFERQEFEKRFRERFQDPGPIFLILLVTRQGGLEESMAMIPKVYRTHIRSAWFPEYDLSVAASPFNAEWIPNYRLRQN